MSVQWTIQPGDAWAGLVQVRADAIEADIVALVESLLDDVEAYMKAEHRWQNRTGAAEAGLYTDIEHAVREFVYLLMSHGPTVEYAVFLEYAHAGRFEILSTTTDQWWPILYRGVVGIVRRYSD